MDNATGKPVAAARVNLSIIGERDIQVVQTDSTGRFYFALPDHVDRKDIFLCADVLPGITPEILINNDFCSKPVSLPAPLFTLSEQEQQTALMLAVNARVNEVFGGDTISSNPVEKEITNSFYGVPSQVLFIDKYIELPTLEEYFTELPVTVKLRKVQGKKQFRFYHSDNEVMEADPLILVDWVAVTDIEKVLKMSPPDIDRIELLDAFYLKGDITYGGIISFISKKNDFAGIDLPTSGTFVNYRFYEKCEMPRYPEILPATIPDPRNTVYWNPSLQLNNQSNAEVSFIAPDTPGRYSILLRGMTKSGEIISRLEIIVVKNR